MKKIIAFVMIVLTASVGFAKCPCLENNKRAGMASLRARAAKAQEMRQALQDVVQGRLIVLADVPAKLSLKALKEKVRESETYKSQITEKVDAHFVIVNKAEEALAMGIAQSDITQKNIWFVEIGEATKLSGKIAETRVYNQKGTAKGREALRFPSHIMNRVIYIENRKVSYDDKSLYETIRRSKDYAAIGAQPNALFYVIQKNNVPNMTQENIEAQNIWFVVFKKEPEISGMVSDIGYLKIVDGKIATE